MDFLIFLFIGLCVVLSFVLYVLGQSLNQARAMAQSARLALASKEREIQGLRHTLHVLHAARAIDVPQLPAADKTTADLIRLAVRNPNENEARTAALKACKRMYEKL